MAAPIPSEAPETVGSPVVSGYRIEEIVFPSGLVGCPDWRRFALIEDPEVPAVRLLQSRDEPSVGLYVAPVDEADRGFFNRLAPADWAALEALGVGAAPGVAVYCTVSLHTSGEVTANLLGPLVIDHSRGFGVQLVLADSPLSTRHVVAPGGKRG